MRGERLHSARKLGSRFPLSPGAAALGGRGDGSTRSRVVLLLARCSRSPHAWPFSLLGANGSPKAVFQHPCPLLTLCRSVTWSLQQPTGFPAPGSPDTSGRASVLSVLSPPSGAALGAGGTSAARQRLLRPLFFIIAVLMAGPDAALQFPADHFRPLVFLIHLLFLFLNVGSHFPLNSPSFLCCSMLFRGPLSLVDTVRPRAPVIRRAAVCVPHIRPEPKTYVPTAYVHGGACPDLRATDAVAT